jgi:hypothetical protein
MKSILLTYPGFQSLPKGVKKMLVTSETHFFKNAKHSSTARREAQGIIVPPQKPGQFGSAQYDYPSSTN